MRKTIVGTGRRERDLKNNRGLSPITLLRKEELVVVLNASLFCGHMAISSTIKDTALASAQKPRHLQVEFFPKKERSTGIIHDRKVFGFTETLAH